MTSVFAPMQAITPQEFRRLTEVTLPRICIPHSRGTRAYDAAGPRIVIQVGSNLSHRSIPLQSAYCAASMLLKGFTNSLRSELIHDGRRVRVTMVQLPAINTPQFDWART